MTARIPNASRPIRPRRASLSALLVAVVLAAWAAAPASAEEALRGPVLEPQALDLLPLDGEARARFYKEHGTLVYRTQALHRQLAQTRSRLAQHKNQGDEEGRKLQAEVRRLGAQVSALMARLTDELLPYGVDGPLVAWMNHAPEGEGRLQRYSYGLVLMLDDLDATQRPLFEQVVTQIEGAHHAIAAQQERTMLALQQSELPKDKQRDIQRTFERQLQVIDQRFWMLVDYALTRDQKVTIWNRLPERLKRKSQPIEHMYALPGLSVSQASRLKALMTEIEHEASPDQAAQRRLAVELRDRKLPAKARDELSKARNAAGARLADLEAFRRRSVRKILTEDQWLEFVAIPPRISINERRGSFSRVLGGWTPSPGQRDLMARIARDAQEKRRTASKLVADLRRKGAEYGPDSPQMMSMQMEMAGAQAETAAANREQIAAIFTQVMDPAEVSQWVLGHWGYKR